MLEIALAVIAGILTIAAPCIILPLPILFGTSVGQVSKSRPLFITLGFVLTFATLGLTLNFLVQSLMIPPNALRNIAAIILALFGIFMIWPTPFERLSGYLGRFITGASQLGQKAGTGNFGGFII
jgi:cytochrome c biogenesis protein CcdA